MDYDEAKEKKLAELQKKYEEQQGQEQREMQAEAQLNEIMRRLLSPEAKARLGNVKLVNKELYLKAAQALIYLYQAGKVTGKISDADMKALLEKLSAKRETKITRK